MLNLFKLYNNSKNKTEKKIFNSQKNITNITHLVLENEIIVYMSLIKILLI